MLILTKTLLGNFLGDFSLSLGDFFTKTSGHPGCLAQGVKVSTATVDVTGVVMITLHQCKTVSSIISIHSP